MLRVTIPESILEKLESFSMLCTPRSSLPSILYFRSLIPSFEKFITTYLGCAHSLSFPCSRYRACTLIFSSRLAMNMIPT